MIINVLLIMGISIMVYIAELNKKPDKGVFNSKEVEDGVIVIWIILIPIMIILFGKLIVFLWSISIVPVFGLEVINLTKALAFVLLIKLLF